HSALSTFHSALFLDIRARRAEVADGANVVSETDMTKALSRFFLIVILAGGLSARIVIRPDIDVNPTFGSPAGGDRIRITFLGSATNTCATGLICTPIVTFDGLPARLAENNTGSIVVVTPPHPRGDVMISI